MKSIVLDTNSYSAMLKGDRQVKEYVRQAVNIGLPVVVLGEIYYGIFAGSKTIINFSDL